MARRHPRWAYRFTPTLISWFNPVEGFFAQVTRRRLRYGVFSGGVDLYAAINRFIAEHNEIDAKPLIWRTDSEKISSSRKRLFQALESVRQCSLCHGRQKLP